MDVWVPLKFCSDLFYNIIFEDVPDLDVIEIFDQDSAFITSLNLFDVILESLERTHLAFIDDDVVP